MLFQISHAFQWAALFMEDIGSIYVSVCGMLGGGKKR